MTASDPIAQLRTTARENQILDAAVAVFAEQGFHTTTIHAIAQRAGIADGTIYNYFGSKTDLLLAIFERMREAVLQDAPPTFPGELELREALALALKQALSALQDDQFALFRVVMSEMMVNAELRQQYVDAILAPTLQTADVLVAAEAERRGIDLDPAQARLAVRTVSATVTGLMLAHVLGDETVQAEWERLPDYLAGHILTLIEAAGRNQQ